MKKKFSEKISDVWGVPKSVVMDIPLISLQGNRELRVEGYKSILKYSDRETAFLTKDFAVHIFGSGLTIDQMDTEALYISGNFERIEYR